MQQVGQSATNSHSISDGNAEASKRRISHTSHWSKHVLATTFMRQNHQTSEGQKLSRNISETDLSLSLILQYPVGLVEKDDAHLALAFTWP